MSSLSPQTMLQYLSDYFADTRRTEMKVIEKIQELVGPIKTLLCIVVFHAMEMKDEAWMGGLV